MSPYIIMQCAIEKLCEILIEQNTSMYKMIKQGTFNKKMLMEQVLSVVSKMLKKMVKIVAEAKLNIEAKAKSKKSINEPEAKPKKSRRKTEQDNEYEKLIQRINKINDDKIQHQMEGENDELISRLNRLKPVK